MKRVFSMLLVIAMVMAMLPQINLVALATEQETTAPTTEVVAPVVDGTEPVAPSVPTETVIPSVPVGSEAVNGSDLVVDQTLAVSLKRGRATVSFIPQQSGKYMFSEVNAVAVYGYVYLEDDTEIAEGDFPLVATLEQGVTYWLDVEATSHTELNLYVTMPAELVGVSLQQAEWKPCNNGDWQTYEQDGTYRKYYEYRWWDQPFVADFSDGSQVVFRPSDGMFYHPSGSETYQVEFFNYQSAENAWQPGNTYTVDMEINDVPYADELWIDPIPEISLNIPQDAVIDAQGQWAWFYFVPDRTAEYTFTANGSSDTYGYLYDANFNELGKNDDGADNNQFKIVYTLEEGVTYYLAAQYYSSGDTGSFPVYISRDASVESITFEPVYLDAYTCGWPEYDDYGQIRYYYDWNQWHSQLRYTVRMSDGTEIMGSGNSVIIGDSWESIEYLSDQGTNPWLPGNSYEAKVTLNGTEYYVPVTIGGVETLSAEGETVVNITTPGQEVKFYFTPEKSGTYSFVSDCGYDTEAALHNLAYQDITGNDDYSEDNKNFEVTYELEAGVTYVLNVHFSYKTENMVGSFPIRVVKPRGIERIEFDPVTLTAYKDGERRSVFSGMESYFHYYWWNYLSYRVIMTDGTEYTFTGDYFTLNGQEYYLSCQDPQDYNNSWQVGGSYEATVMVAENTYPVTVSISEPNYPEIYLDAPYTVTLTEQDYEYFLEFIPQKSGVYIFTSESNEDTRADLYDQEFNQLIGDDDGGEGNNFQMSYTLEAGKIYYINARFYSQHSGSFNVLVTKEMGIQSITVSPISIPVGTCGSFVSMDPTVAGDSRFFRYYWWNQLSYTVEFENGTSCTGTGMEFYHEGRYYNLEYSDTQSQENPWTVGNTYTPNLSAMGVSADVQVTIAPITDAVVTVEDVSLLANSNGYTTNIYDPETDSYKDVFIYRWWNEVPVTLDFGNGNFSTSTGGGASYQGYHAPKGYSTLDQEQNPWQPGNTYCVSLEVLGQIFQVNVTIQENPVDRIEFHPLSLVEHTCGEWSTYYDYEQEREVEYYRYYWWEKLSCTVYLKDGTSFEGTGTSFSHDGMLFSFGTSDIQGDQEQWTLGNQYTCRVEAFGQWYEIPVTIREDPIAAVTFDTIYMMESSGGCWEYPYSSGEGFYRYYWWDNIRFTIHLKDGTSVPGSGRYVEYEDQSYYINWNDNQYGEHWYPGGTYTAQVMWRDQWEPIEIKIVENPVSRVEFDTIKLERDDGHEEADYSSGLTYWHYDWEDNLSYRVYLNDGNVIDCTGLQFTVNGMTFRLNAYDYQGYYDPWRAGTTRRVDIELGGQHYSVEVQLPDVSIEELGYPVIEPNREYTVTITEPGQRMYFAFSPAATGEYVFYSYFNDGNNRDTHTTLYNSGMGEITSDDDSGEGNNFLLRYTLEAGRVYVFDARFLNYDALGSFQVKLMQPEKVTSVSVEPMSFMMGTCGGMESINSGAQQYFRYYWWDYMRYTVTFENGDVVTGTGTEFTRNQLTYQLVHDDTQRYQPWTEGKTYQVNVSVQDVSCAVQVTIENSPVDRIVLDPLVLNAETSGYRTEYWDDVLQQYVPVYRYNWWNYVSGTVYLTTGDQLPIRNGGYQYNGEYHSIGFTNNQHGNFWQLGGTYTETVSVMGVSQPIAISIVTPVESVSAEPIFLLEGTGGEYVGGYSGMEMFYRYYWWNQLRFTVTYKNGSQMSYAGNGLYYENNYVQVISIDDQNSSPWQVGNSYTASIRVMGVETPVQVHIISEINGQFGNVNWSLGTGGVLQLLGEGDILWDQNYRPWDEHRNSIRNIVIGEGITAIPDRLFEGHGNVEAVTMADTVTRIGIRAFADCGQLREMYFSKYLESIGREAFIHCVNLGEISLGGSLHTIEQYAFAWCTNLQRVYLPDTLQRIESYAFDGCYDLAYVDYSGSQDAWELLEIGAGNGNLYQAYVTCSGAPTEVGSGEIGSLSWMLNTDGVLNIYGTGDMEDFSPEAPAPWNQCGQPIRKIVLGEGVFSLGSYAFYGCTELKLVTFPESLRKVGEGAFHSCRNLRVAMFGPALAEIGNYAFYDCGALYEIYLSACLERIGDAAFSGCDGLAEIYYSAAGYLWGAIEIGYDNEALDNAYRYTVEDEDILKSGVCGEDLIWTLSADHVFTVSGTGRMYDYDFRTPMWTDLAGDIYQLEIESGVTYIGNGAFSHLYMLENVQLPGTLEEIGMQAFFGAESLEELKLPEGLVAIGEEAFSHCTGLRTLVLPESLVTISFESFGYCRELTEVTIPAATTNMAHNVFSGCEKLTGIRVSQDNSAYCDVGGVLMTKDGKELICAPGGLTGSYTIPEGVESISLHAFQGCTNLTEIIIPDSVREIGPQAFQGCINLEKVTLGSGLTVISMGMFANTGLTSLVIPEGITEIQESAFESCTNLTQITIPESVTRIYDRAFAGCVELVSAPLPASLTYLGNKVFEGCGKLQSVTIPESVTEIGEFAFANCEGLTEVIVPATVQSVGAYAFRGCVNLQKLELAEGVTSIGDGAFEACVNLTEAKLPEGVTALVYRMFAGCESLETVEIPSTVISIGEQTFAQCTGLTQVDIPDSVETLGERVFAECESLQTVTLGKGVREVSTALFNDCFALSAIHVSDMNANYSSDLGVLLNKEQTELLRCPMAFEGVYEIPETVQRMADNAFRGCQNLTGVTLPSGISYIPAYCFADCVNLQSVDLTKTSVSEIGRNAFVGCVGLENITFPETLRIIGAEALANCHSLTTVTLPEGLEEIYWYAFGWCSQLREVYLPKSLTAIYEGGFYICNNLDTIYYAGTEGSWRQISIEHGNENLQYANLVFGSQAQITGLNIERLPDKLEYRLGEALDLNGLLLLGIFDDGTSSYVQLDEVSGYDPHTTGEQTVTVRYGEFTASFTVTVRAWPVEINAQPVDRTAEVGGNALFTVTANHVASYQWQYRRTATSNWTNTSMTGYNTDTLTVAVTATRNGYQYRCKLMGLDGETYYTDAATLIVGQRFVEGIRIDSLPNNMSFYLGEEPDFIGLAVSACYSDGTFEDVTALCAVEGMDYQKPGEYPVTVSYEGFTAEFVMLVLADYVISIRITTLPAKTQYVLGENLELGDMVVIATMASRTEIQLYDYVISGYDPYVLGEQTVTVSYEEYSDSFAVTVNTPPATIISQPADQYAQVGEEARFHVEATGAVSYKWQYRRSETASWMSTTMTGYNTDTLTVAVTAARNGYQYRCAITGEDGQVIYTEPATLYVVEIVEPTEPVPTEPVEPTEPVPTEPVPTEPAVTVVGIEITQLPNKTTYFVGEELDLTGLIVTVTYDDGTTNQITDGFDYINGDTSGFGIRGIFLGYRDYSVTLDITVCVGGTCGETVTWALNPNGVLTVSGQGAMEDDHDSSNVTSAPWGVYADQIQTVVIEEGVTYIGAEAFYGLKKLTSLVMADTVEEVGYHAFCNCYNLASVQWSAGLKVIRQVAFGSCNGLTEVILPEGLITVEASAFASCEGLQTVVIPSTVTDLCGDLGIHNDAFAWCDNLSEFIVSEENPVFSSDADGILYNKDKTVIYQAPAAMYGSYTMRDSVLRVDYPGFHDSKLTEIVVGENVKVLDMVFRNCQNLEVIRIPVGIETIHDFIGFGTAFSDIYKLRDVYYGGTAAQWEKVQIPDSYFKKVIEERLHTVAPQITHLSFHKLVEKLVYEYGEELDLTGLILKVLFHDDTTAEIIEGYTVSGYSANVVGKQTVTVSYEGFEASFEVEVLPQIKEIVKQPQSITANSGETVQFTVEATGDIVSYQWQYRSLYKWFNTSMDGYNTDTLTVAATGQRHGYEYRCVITFADGTTLETEPAELTVHTTITITDDPNDQVVGLGAKGQFTAAAEGEGIKYQWQYCRPGSEKWIDTAMEGATKPTVFIECTTARNGYQYRCAITDVAGNVAYTEAAVLSVLSFKSQPADVYAPVNGTATFTVTTSVESGFTYQWQYRRNAAASWTNTTMTGYNTATLTVGATKARNGYEYRCVLTGAKNSKIESRGAVLHVSDPVVITAQPQSITATAADTVQFTVDATNVYSYQWQYKNRTMTNWKNTTAEGNQTATLNIAAKGKNGYTYRCVLTGMDGIVYYTEVATLTVG